jgi:sugar lactone lactonase YvrE
VRVKWLTTSTQFAAQPVERDATVYRYDIPQTDGQYLLFENRQKIGSDKYLPGHGLLSWRIDPDRAELGAWNGDERHPAIALTMAAPYPGTMLNRLLRIGDVPSMRLTGIKESKGVVTATPLLGYNQPAVSAERARVNMTALVGQTAETHTVAVRRDSNVVNWTARASQPWLLLKETGDSLSFTADPLGLPPGEYVDTVSISNARGEVASKVAVDLRVAMPGMPEIIATALPWSWGLAAQSGRLLQASYGWDVLGLRPRPRVLQLWDGVSRPSTLARVPADALYAPVIVDQNTSYVIARARDINYLYRVDANGNAEVVAAGIGDGPAYGAALMPDGAIIVAEWSGRLHRITPDGQVGSYGKLNAHLYQIATDKYGNLYASTYEGRVIRMSPTGASSVIATGFEKGKLVAIATTPEGDLYVSERGAQGRIIRISRDGVRETLLQRRGAQFYGIAIDDHFVYAIDLRNRELLRIPREGLPVTPTFAQGMFQ